MVNRDRVDPAAPKTALHDDVCRDPAERERETIRRLDTGELVRIVRRWLGGFQPLVVLDRQLDLFLDIDGSASL